jgi:L-cysteine desulfidase
MLVLNVIEIQGICCLFGIRDMKISENTSVSMPMKNMIGIIVAVAMGVFAYTEVTARLTSLETSRELFQNDLLKKSEQVPVDQEQLFLLEDLYKTVEKIEIRIEDMMHNKVNIEFVTKQLEKALEDIEDLKDKVRANGNDQ